MRLTVEQLRRIIKEEIENLHEIRPDYRIVGTRDSHGLSRDEYNDNTGRGSSRGEWTSGRNDNTGNANDLADVKRELGASIKDKALRHKAEEYLFQTEGDTSEVNILKTMAWLNTMNRGS
jgi:hypothetical protein